MPTAAVPRPALANPPGSREPAHAGGAKMKRCQVAFDAATVGALLVFFVFALQCTSTLAIMRRETNSWRWPAFAFSYLLALAYGASFLTHRVIDALV